MRGVDDVSTHHLRKPRVLSPLRSLVPLAGEDGPPEAHQRYAISMAYRWFRQLVDRHCVVAGHMGPGGWGGGYSHFFFIRRLGPSIYRSPPPPPKKKKKKKKKYQEFQAPQKYLKFWQPKKIPRFCTLT